MDIHAPQSRYIDIHGLLLPLNNNESVWYSIVKEPCFLPVQLRFQYCLPL